MPVEQEPRSAVVTGCGQGIGRAVVERLLQDGWFVVGIERDDAHVDDLNALLRDRGSVVEGDVRERDTFSLAVARARELAPLMAWINNAGIIRNGNLHEVNAKEVAEVFEINLLGYYWGTSAAVREFLRSGTPGSIVNISSIHGRFSFPSFAAYDTAKGGVESLTRYVAVEYGPAEIRANCVAPGAIRTPLFEWFKKQSDTPDEVERENSLLHPFERLGEASEVAAVVSFLVSRDASFVSGQIVGVDGGASARCFRFDPDPEVQAVGRRGVAGGLHEIGWEERNPDVEGVTRAKE